MKKLLSRTTRRLFSAVLLGVLSILSFYPAHVLALVKPGSLLVVDRLGDDFDGALYLVDSEGRRRILSRLQDEAQGPKVFNPSDITVAPDGFIYLTSDKLLLKVNPLTGNRQLVTDLEDPNQGPVGEGLLGVAADGNGYVYAADATSVLFRVDAANGVRSIVSHLDDDSQGTPISLAGRLVLETDTQLLVLDNNKIVPLDLTDGTRGEPILPFSFNSFSGLAIEPSGNLLVTSFSNRELLRIDRDSGDQSVVSDFGNAEEGPLARILEDVTVNPKGEIFVVDSQANASLLRNGAVFKVEPETGIRSLLSNFGDETQGPTGFSPNAIRTAVAVTPTPEEERLVRSVLLATESLKAQKNALVNSGNLIANGASGATVINKGAVINQVAATPEENFEVAGNSLTIKKSAVVGTNVVVGNRFRNQGTVLGTETINDFPILSEALPPFQKAVPGDAKILVNKNGFLILPEGMFKSITVKKGATLVFEGGEESPGIYQAETFKAAKQAKILYQGAFELRVSKGAKFGTDSVLRPDNPLLDAKDAVLFVAGGFKTGNGSEIQANIVGPESDCKFGKRSHLIGSAYCRRITLGKSAEATLRNFLEDSLVDSE